MKITENSFDAWKSQLTQLPGYPNDAESRLAFDTLRICLVNDQIDDSITAEKEDVPKVTENGYALFDYTMICYFIFRARLCLKLSQEAIDSYDTYIQNLMTWFFDHFFHIPKETTGQLISSRATEYERILKSSNENTYQALNNAFISFMEKDFAGFPESDKIPITDFMSHFWLTIKVSQCVLETLKKLESEFERTQQATGIKHTDAPQEQRSYIYATAANGMEVRIPAEHYESWKAAQDRIRQGEKTGADTETAKRLASLMRGETPPEEKRTATSPAENAQKHSHTPQPSPQIKKHTFIIVKILIWIGCIFICSLIQVILGYAGLILGGIPTVLLFALMWFSATKLCKKWDFSVGKKVVAASGLSHSNYVEHTFSQAMQDHIKKIVCSESNKTIKEQFKYMMEKGEITNDQYCALMYIYFS